MSGLREKIKSEEYDVIILDLKLTDSNASASLSAIREIKRISNASLIVVSGVMEFDIKKRSMDAGADAFIHKIESENGGATALISALYAAVIHHPKKDMNPSYLEHVKALERLVGKV